MSHPHSYKNINTRKHEIHLLTTTTTTTTASKDENEKKKKNTKM